MNTGGIPSLSITEKIYCGGLIHIILQLSHDNYQDTADDSIYADPAAPDMFEYLSGNSTILSRNGNNISMLKEDRINTNRIKFRGNGYIHCHHYCFQRLLWTVVNCSTKERQTVESMLSSLTNQSHSMSTAKWDQVRETTIRFLR